ncbi:MAG: CPXCG motif-containing cysteine-rich protein [Halioglobus sp.]
MPVGDLEQKAVSCPYCGELIQVLIDQEEAGQSYIEDCQVCCRPIVFKVEIDTSGYLSVSAQDENEALY